MSHGNLLQLLHLSDPALPIGSFAHSAGLETYVHAGIVKDKHSAKEFIEQQLSQNIFYTDAALVSLTYDSAANNNLQAILELDEICNAVKLPKEIRVASNKLGLCLLKIFQQKDDLILVNKYVKSIKERHAFGHYSISFGLLAHALNISKTDAITGFYYNAAAGFVTNSVKLVPLGQHDGQNILKSLFPLISELVKLSLSPDKSMIGFCCAGFDLRCMQHEHLHSRLYMS